MAKKSKGFGELLSETRSKGFQPKGTSQSQGKIDQSAISNFINIEPLEKKEARLHAIFSDSTTIPSVSSSTFRHFREYLKSTLPKSLPLTGIEPFGWEDFYVYGLGQLKDHHAQRQELPSYQDDYQLQKILDSIDEKTGIQAEVARTQDGQIFVLPLKDLKVNRDTAQVNTVLEDYRFWWTSYSEMCSE